MVRGVECSSKVRLATDDILFVWVRILHTDVEVGDRSGGGAVRPKAFLFRAEIFAGFYEVRRQNDYTWGPKLVDRIGQCDEPVVV